MSSPSLFLLTLIVLWFFRKLPVKFCRQARPPVELKGCASTTVLPLIATVRCVSPCGFTMNEASTPYVRRLRAGLGLMWPAG